MSTNDINSNDNRDAGMNRDPISGAPGAHPVGVAVGATVGGVAAGIASGAALGAVTGTAVGPIGTVIGAAVGAIAGGLAGKSIAEGMDPTVEQDYWRANYMQRPYFEAGRSYDDYGPAYGVGAGAFSQNPGRSFDEVEPNLSRDWSVSKRNSTLDWASARQASQDAWNRLKNSAEPTTPSASDHYRQ